MTQKYVLGSSDSEVARLEVQADILADATALMFERAGIRPGMHVLDLGSGPGDVAFLVARMVGAQGSVLGVEFDPAQIGVANRRLAEMNLPNVEFVEGDARIFTGAQPYDAIVCRLLLTHLTDVGKVLAHHMTNLRAGGLFVAVDYDTGGFLSLPEVALYSRYARWIEAGLSHGGSDPRAGMRLPALFDKAGFADVQSLGVQKYYLPRDHAMIEYAVRLARTLQTSIVDSGAAANQEMDLETLPTRLADALRERDAVWTFATLIGNWGRRP